MLIYVGRGSFVPGIPARDLTDEEVVRFGLSRLLETGLYKKPGKKSLLGGAENKAVARSGQEVKEND